MKTKSIVFTAILMVLAVCGSIAFGQETWNSYNSTDTPTLLLELGTTASTLVIADSGFITWPSVKLDISHEAVNELEVYLIGPDGTRIKLFANIGAGSDMTDTWFDDRANTSITNGVAPFTGNYLPEGNLSDFDFRNIEGTWTLEIEDNTPGISGVLNWWRLRFGTITSNLYFEDTFPSTTIEQWINIDGATVDEIGINKPSAPYSLRLNGDPSGGDSLMSRAINLSGCLGATFTYSYERTAPGISGGEPPDKGEDLIIEYNAGSGWIELDRQPGDGPDMTSFEQVSILLPPEALRKTCLFRIRRAAGTVGPYDDWFVDDVKIELINSERPGIVSNTSFEGQTWGWTTTQTFSSSQWQSDGSYSARVFSIPQITQEAGAWVGLSQSIDMSNVVAIRFDASTTASSGGTWENCVASVCIDDTEVWSDTGADKTWLDILIDTAEYTGVHTLSLRLSFLETGNYDEDLHFDNIRTYLDE